MEGRCGRGLENQTRLYEWLDQPPLAHGRGVRRKSLRRRNGGRRSARSRQGPQIADVKDIVMPPLPPLRDGLPELELASQSPSPILTTDDTDKYRI